MATGTLHRIDEEDKHPILAYHDDAESQTADFSNMKSSTTSSIRMLKNRPLVYLTLALGLLAVVFFRQSSDTHATTFPAGIVKSSSQEPLKYDTHPVQRLALRGEAAFERLIAKQSKSATEAAAEYRRRYGRRPPPHFDAWFNLARESDLVLVDEFDAVMTSLEPFWGVNPTTLNDRFQQTMNKNNMVHLIVNHTGFWNSSEHRHSELIEGWLSEMPWQQVLDHVDFLVNTMDEPRVSVTYDMFDHVMNVAPTQHSSLDKASPEIAPGGTEVNWHNFGHEPTWQWLLDSCRPSDAARSWVNIEKPVVNDSLRFVSDPAELADPCRIPELRHLHSIWFSPSNLDITKQLVPILSQARPKHFNDILYPSAFYSQDIDNSPYIEAEDIPWDEKIDRVYWVGTANAGWPRKEDWQKINRQAMTILTTNKPEKPITLLSRDTTVPSSPTWVKRLGSVWGDVYKYFHLRISYIDYCPNDACAAQEEYFKPVREDIMEYAKSRYCLDLDGTSYSGRYYRLLKSNCAVMKQTVFEEWHDGWLVPWVHYIPVSPDAHELPELTRFLIEEPEGREIGRNVAAQGKDWSRKVLRREDMKLVFLRILMEMQRIMRHDRNDLFYEG